MYRVVSIDSSYDAVTDRLLPMRDALCARLIESNISVLRFRAEQAKRRAVLDLLKKGVPALITGMGHGDPRKFTGHNGETVFRAAGRGEPQLGGSVVHLLSCYTAQKLGPQMVGRGCVAFFGYDRPFALPMNDCDPLFFLCDSEIVFLLLRGLTAGEVHDAVAALFEDAARHMEAKGYIVEAVLLRRNRVHLCSPRIGNNWGDKDARI